MKKRGGEEHFGANKPDENFCTFPTGSAVKLNMAAVEGAVGALQHPPTHPTAPAQQHVS